MRVQLPPGCYGLSGANGEKKTARAGTSVVVSDETAARIRRGDNAKLGIIRADQPLSFGTKRGRRCTSCRFLGHAWSVTCPRCGSPTEEEE